MVTQNAFVEVGQGFWNARGSFKKFGLVEIGILNIQFLQLIIEGTHMSIARLSSGKFLVIDAIPLTQQIKKEFDELTENGTKIEAVLATHPFHTLAFPAFHKAYPDVPYYGAPRHLRTLTGIPWAGDLNVCSTRNQWNPEVEMSIPEGSEFVAPFPESSNHFSSVLVFHKESKTIHVDDTIMYADNPGFILRLVGYRHGKMSFHTSTTGPGLHPTAEAPLQFRDWVQGLIDNWDFDNICIAHFANKIGGAKALLQETLTRAEPLFQRLSESNKNKGPIESSPVQNVEGNECG
jgi:hypothetical protein